MKCLDSFVKSMASIVEYKAFIVTSEDVTREMFGLIRQIHGFNRQIQGFDRHIRGFIHVAERLANRYHQAIMPPGRALDHDAVRFGAIVNRLRYERRWTLLDLGRFSGMHPTYLGVLERGKNMPTLATIVRLAKVFGIEAAELVREVEQARAKKTRSE